MKTPRIVSACWNLGCLLACLPAPGPRQDPPPDLVAIQNPRLLAPGEIRCQRVAIGEPGDYKPCIARMPDGELLLTAFHQDKREDNKVQEQMLLFRSKRRRQDLVAT